MSSLKLLFVLSEWSSLQSLQSGLCNGAPPHTGSQLECGEVNDKAPTRLMEADSRNAQKPFLSQPFWLKRGAVHGRGHSSPSSP